MKLSAAAVYFDKDPVYDAYTGDYLFNCQFSSFDDSQSSGATSRRRVLSTAPQFDLPARRVVTIFGEPWVGGDSHLESFKGRAIRYSANLKKASGLYNLLTPSQACLSATGTQAYGHGRYLKDTIDSTTSSEYDPFWNVFLSITETITKGMFMRLGSVIYRVRSRYITDDQYQLAQVDELDASCLRTATFTKNGIYDITTDSYPTVSVATPVLVLDMPKFYRLRDGAEDYEKAGDITVFVPQSALTPVINATFTMPNQEGTMKTWRVVTINDESDAWALHVRHV